MNQATAEWRTSSFTEQHDCVEVALTPDTAAVRDTKNRTGGTLTFPESSWRSLTRAL
jgi:hypothetical protein